MKYILQVFTGGWHNANYKAQEIIERIAKIRTLIPVQSVIIGWNTDAGLYRSVNAYLHENGISSCLWLPVFSETGELFEMSKAVDLSKNPIGSLALQEGENFEFCCPSDERNIQSVFKVYETYFADCGFDGVFLDKIRTQSFVGGIAGALSCGCASCQRMYAEQGLPLEEVLHAYRMSGDAFLETSGYESGVGFVMKDSLAEQFLKIKAQIIAQSISEICDYFHKKGMKTGLDLYVPLLSRFTGQQYDLISASADFIKPMLYRRTEAPAGISYEYRLLKQSLPHAQNYPDLRTDVSFLRAQLDEMRNLSCAKYPGIEVNYRQDIARTDAEYVYESVKALKEGGMDGAVLAWDVMLAPDRHIEILKEI